MTNIKETREYQLAIENYKTQVESYLTDKTWGATQDELKAISKTLSIFGMTTDEELEIIRGVRTELGLSTRNA
jgi:hypothetical protein